uniref:Uncharacterized protein n=1 Tax=Clastoptera arizonana TaxID=38151 RepID=A0A1B6D7B1_9HEMI
MVTAYDHQKIVIDNLLKDETVYFSILLVKGHINRTNNFTENQNDIITVENSSQYSSWPIINKTFKCLVELKIGFNNITFQHNQDKIDLQITYKPRISPFSVTPLYIICKDHNGCFQAPAKSDNSINNACAKIALGAKLIQCLTAEKLYEQGYGRKTFQLESDSNLDVPECFTFYSNLSVSAAKTMEEEELWTYFGREIMTSHLSSSSRKYFGFLSCTEWQSLGGGKGQVRAHAALGGGGLALFGTGCLHTWPSKVEEILPCFLNDTQVDTNFLMDDSCHRGTYGACFSTTLGAACHELGHTFDLGHSNQGIMSRGFDNIHLVFLAFHPETVV